MQDGLGSVRAVVDGTLAVQERRMYAPYGEPYDGVGTSQTVYGFTGEPTDANELVYLRARYLSPGLGVFVSRDPFEGFWQNARTLNGYDYVWGNPVNRVDASGMCSQATIEAGRQAGSVLRSLPEVTGAILCAAEDAAVAAGIVRNVTMVGQAVDVAAVVTGAAAAAGGAVVLSVAALGILVGVTVYIGVNFPPIPYTSQELQAFRPPMPPQNTPNPNVTQPAQPQRATATAAAPQTQPQPMPAPAATCQATPTPTSTRRPPRGAFLPGTNDVLLLGRLIPNGTRTTLSDAVGIIDLWMGDPPWFSALNERDVLFASIPSIDDRRIHSYRQTDRDVNAADPHFNLEAGGWQVVPGDPTPTFRAVGNLHLYFS